MPIIRSILLAWLLAASPAATEQQTADVAWRPFTLEGYHGQSLAGELGTLAVPARRAAGDGRTLELDFVRLPSTAAAPRSPIVYLDGGPGSSAINLARIPAYFDAFRALTAVADVILLDQRGVGRSGRALYCPPAEGARPPLELLAGDLAAIERAAVALAAACRETLRERGVDLAAYTTRESADDLEDLRRALGAERLSLLGFSYGTHLALTAVRRHGARLERVAMIGVEGPDHTRKLPSSLDTQMRKLSLLAARDPAVGKLVPDMYALLEKILRELEEKPFRVPVELGRGEGESEIVEVPVGPAFLRMILTWDVGDGNDFPVFPALLHTIDRGDPSLLAWFVRKRLPRFAGGLPAHYFAVDGASGVSPERRARIARETPGAILGNVANAYFPAVPEALGVAPLDDGFRAPIASDVETLFVSGTLDSNAPPYQAEELRWGFPRGVHLIVDNAGHEDMLGHPEVTAVLVDFFRGLDVGDRHVALPPPRFLSVEEAVKERLGAR